MVPTRLNVAMARRSSVGLARLEARADDGDAHRLFLEQRHAERLVQDVLPVSLEG